MIGSESLLANVYWRYSKASGSEEGKAIGSVFCCEQRKEVYSVVSRGRKQNIALRAGRAAVLL
jgi:hypothetical protein